MFEWFQAALDAQKRLLDIQARQIRVFEDMMKAAQAQTGAQMTLNKAAETQSMILQNWLGLWGVKR
ncbi:MAG TPA: hypothetical protein VF503_23180 [Sphingobium sp.]|uniref:hypothetical protein n=1 Tax=Sphingobium sp. TaxID=1912891 RepID=UPI002ED5E0C4